MKLYVNITHSDLQLPKQDGGTVVIGVDETFYGTSYYDTYVHTGMLKAIPIDEVTRDLIDRLRLQPEDIGGPSRMDMLRERIEAANALEALLHAYVEAKASLDNQAITPA